MSYSVTNLTAWETFGQLEDGLSEEAGSGPGLVGVVAGSGGGCFLLLLVALAVAIHKNLIQCERGIRAVSDLLNAIAKLTRRERDDAPPTPPQRDLVTFPGVLTDDDLLRLRAQRIAALACDQPLYAVPARSEYV